MREGKEPALRPLKRVRYVHGMLLSAEDFTDEQQYFIEKQRRHNRYLHGIGVVSGLEISVTHGSAGKDVISISPGFALDPLGNEIVVSGSQEEEVSSSDQAVYVSLYYAEKVTDQLPLVSPVDELETSQGSRIEESFIIKLTKNNPLSEDEHDESADQTFETDQGIPLARLRFEQGHWEIDPEFKRPCVKH